MTEDVYPPGTPPAERESHPGVTDSCGQHWTWNSGKGHWINDDPEFSGPGYTHVSAIIADFGPVTPDPIGYDSA